MAEIFLEISSLCNLCEVPIETVVVLFIIKYCKPLVKINFVRIKKQSQTQHYFVDIAEFSYQILEVSDLPINAKLCELPNLTLNSSTCVAGLCGCLRQIIKLSIKNDLEHDCTYLLGFKESCLLACAENSTWTKFCEIDLISTLKTFDKNSNSTELPPSLMRFEAHMAQPVRLHNIFKYTMSKKWSDDKIQKSDNSLEHCYAEGPFITLADMIIFICFHTLFTFLPKEKIFKLLPLSKKWYERMMDDEKIEKCLIILTEHTNVTSEVIYSYPTLLDHQSIYKTDAKRCKSRSKILTNQEDVENSLDIFKKMQLNIQFSSKPFCEDFTIDWNKIPVEATPEGGFVPQSRLQKKFEQLENLCNPVCKLAKPGDVIVDFCSGGGHLGIIIAYLLPQCTVILLENKEISLNRSKDRVDKLNLKNIKFIQCNLDYFKGSFNIGMSLHACGVATDLVIQHCLRQNAIFISCPCCYGSIRDCHQVSYPRSDFFRNKIKLRDYLILSHAADQTHDAENVKTKQGYKCMSIIDIDRKLQAQQFDYNVYLMKLTPETCTPKNHLLIGIPKSEYSDNNSINC